MGNLCYNDNELDDDEQFLQSQQRLLQQQLDSDDSVKNIPSKKALKNQYKQPIPEEDSKMAVSSFDYSAPTNSFSVFKQNDEQLESILSQPNLDTKIKIQILNVYSQTYLNSHCVKSKQQKRCYEVSVTKAQEKDYLDWYLHPNGVLEHCLTEKYLVANYSPFSKTFEVCCDNDCDLWQLEMLKCKNGTDLQSGQCFRLVHGQTKGYLTFIRKRAEIKDHFKVILVQQKNLKQSIWKFVHE